ncbi:DUF1127 domain-containing protein [Tritonibacter scottomollicae]|uniref:DUF1127 domain-containing protein n=1 Tax=Tritonibacter scottomollicae TaxID=483013 RepID=A0ABZ0HFZ1_TRISK|nr:DUF1127 domain-containing protein [Tritonibacter scottomollicae]WOI33171.1 DUF1127 domain-containing protein [Tritonibacter scottomollicae]
MAYATNAQANNTFNPLALIAGFFRAIGNGLVHIAESNHRVNRARTLMALSDEELAQRGMKRDDVVKHVFGDIMYI